jgi:hypothetical protein
MSIFRLLYMVERSTCYIADRNRVLETRKQNATEGSATERISGRGYMWNR